MEHQGNIPLFEDTGESFELLAHAQDGTRYWQAREIMAVLAYDSWPSFRNVINKAIGVCMATSTPILENFIQNNRRINGRQVEDFRLTRLACCLIAMNGDPKNPCVARAQLYFAALDRVFQDAYVIQHQSMDRLIARGEISEREVTLSKTAAEHGVEFHGRFQNAGYRGMYNMDLAELKKVKGLPDVSRTLFDFMGKEELAANLFRLTLTEGRIQKEKTRGQRALEYVAEDVGGRVRRTMIEETGMVPERLPIATDIKVVRKGLKTTRKAFSTIDDVESQRIFELEAQAALPDFPTADYFPDCSECVAGSSSSHSGSSQCTTGSIASGGHVAHCGCDFCR